MRLKAFLVVISLIAVGFSNSCPSSALTPYEPTSEKYLIDHGHSKEIVRMINLQKDRTEGNLVDPPKSQNKFKKFFKNIWFEQDFTMPVTDFGYNDIKSVETDKSKIPPAVNRVKAKIIDLKNGENSDDNNEVNINDIKIRVTE